MNLKISMAVATAITLVFIGGATYAGETALNARVQSSILRDVFYMMGGGHGGGMMGGGQGLMDMFGQLFQEEDKSNRKRNNDKEMLRREIREKRQALASQVRSKNPNHKEIERTIEELNRLESKLAN